MKLQIEQYPNRIRSKKRGWLKWILFAILPIVLLAVFHRLGWRDDTAIISGTSIAADHDTTAVRGILYGMTYFWSVVLSPILLLAVFIHGMLFSGSSR